MLKDPPDKRADDILFGDLLGKTHGERAQLATLMGVEPGNVTQQLDPFNRNRSYYHCGKLSIYAGYMMDAVRGEALWQDLVRSREAWAGAKVLRAVESVGDMEIKRLCDNLTTALLSTDEAVKVSAMFMLNGVLSERLRQRMSPAERDREARFAS